MDTQADKLVRAIRREDASSPIFAVLLEPRLLETRADANRDGVFYDWHRKDIPKIFREYVGHEEINIVWVVWISARVSRLKTRVPEFGRMGQFIA